MGRKHRTTRHFYISLLSLIVSLLAAVWYPYSVKFSNATRSLLLLSQSSSSSSSSCVYHTEIRTSRYNSVDKTLIYFVTRTKFLSSTSLYNVKARITSRWTNKRVSQCMLTIWKPFIFLPSTFRVEDALDELARSTPYQTYSLTAIERRENFTTDV